MVDADGNLYLNNHLIINLKFNRLDNEEDEVPSYRVVGFDVLPHSILETPCKSIRNTCLFDLQLIIS